jgi:hypothetical protein
LPGFAAALMMGLRGVFGSATIAGVSLKPILGGSK